MRRIMTLVAALGVPLLAITAFHTEAAQAEGKPLPGKFAVICDFRTSGNIDPIVAPGTTSGHLHDQGGGKFTPDSTRESMVQDGSTSCTVEGDRSAYWAPALYVDGERIEPNTFNAYYGTGEGVRDQTELPPEGWQAIAGHMMGSQDEDVKHVQFNCAEDGKMSLTDAPADCTDGSHPAMRFVFPDCNNGEAKSEDHYSNNAYSENGECPPGYHKILQLIVAVHYPQTENFSDATLASGDWTTAHADVLDGWVRNTQERLVDRCIKNGPGCGIDMTRNAQYSSHKAAASAKPTISHVKPTPGSRIKSRKPTIRATVKDNVTDLSKANITLFVDGKKKSRFSYNIQRNRLSYTTGRLAYKRHVVKVVAKDAAGNTKTRKWAFWVVKRR